MGFFAKGKIVHFFYGLQEGLCLPPTSYRITRDSLWPYPFIIGFYSEPLPPSVMITEGGCHPLIESLIYISDDKRKQECAIMCINMKGGCIAMVRGGCDSRWLYAFGKQCLRIYTANFHCHLSPSLLWYNLCGQGYLLSHPYCSLGGYLPSLASKSDSKSHNAATILVAPCKSR